MLRSPPSVACNNGSKNPENYQNNPVCTIRCEQCNVVINELLAFVCHKVDTLPESGIIQICLSSYSTEEVETARSIVYKLMAPTKRITRRKEGSEQKSIQEIIKLIKEFEPDCLPTFVAQNLNKLPAVSFDHIDITAFLKEMAVLKTDVAAIKAKAPVERDNSVLTSDIESVKNEIINVKKILSDMQNNCSSRLPEKPMHSTLSPRSYHNDKNTGNDLTMKITNDNVDSVSTDGLCGSVESPPAARVRRRRRGSGSQPAAPAPPAPQVTANSCIPTNDDKGKAPLSQAVMSVPASAALSKKQLTSNEILTEYIPTYRDMPVGNPTILTSLLTKMDLR